MGSCETCKHQSKSEGEAPCRNCIHNALNNYEPMTNADRIRSMKDSELLNFLYYEYDNFVFTSRIEIDEWLQSEVETHGDE